MKEVIPKILFYYIAAIAAAYDELVDAIGRIDLHHMPQDRPAANFNHRLGLEMGLFGNASAESSGKNDRLQWPSLEPSWKAGATAATGRCDFFCIAEPVADDRSQAQATK